MKRAKSIVYFEIILARHLAAPFLISSVCPVNPLCRDFSRDASSYFQAADKQTALRVSIFTRCDLETSPGVTSRRERDEERTSHRVHRWIKSMGVPRAPSFLKPALLLETEMPAYSSFPPTFFSLRR